MNNDGYTRCCNLWLVIIRYVTVNAWPLSIPQSRLSISTCMENEEHLKPNYDFNDNNNVL